MRMVYLLFDSLNRHVLGAYGGRAVATPNFDRLAERCVTFERHYVGSMPCMPARRDMQTGRLNFLHRAWGPLEPFDNNLPDLLREAGIYSHLITDHYHYFEDGGAGFHGRYSSWEFVRGQEKDKWKGIAEPDLERYGRDYHSFDFDGRTDPDLNVAYVVNRDFIDTEEKFPIARCFEHAVEFLDHNKKAKNWFLQLECFDPHEPFFAAGRFREGLESGYQGPVLDWLRYGRPSLDGLEAEELRANYLSLVRMCDHYLGRMLDYFDANDLWHDTALIVSTDHGLLLGEHDYWGKNRPPFFNEVAHIPLFIHHPDAAGAAGQRRHALTQTTDLMPTVLDAFGIAVPSEVRGASLVPVLHEDGRVRDACIYGQFGGSVNVTDGRYSYFRYPSPDNDEPLFHYTLMPMHMRSYFEPSELAGATLAPPMGFTKGVPVLRVPVVAQARANMVRRYPLLDPVTALYDLDSDPGQTTPIEDPAITERMAALMRREMARHEAPPEAYRRLDLAPSE